ncbi:MAG: hypothetical protein LBV38_03395 [Alistipes sp.]|nr:hypothetical protein [Alistipes sp.]
MQYTREIGEFLFGSYKFYIYVCVNSFQNTNFNNQNNEKTFYLPAVCTILGGMYRRIHPPSFLEEEVTIGTPLRNVADAVYNEVADVWMMPREILHSPMTRAGTPATPDSEPTHYALKIYPHTEDEQWQVEMMKDIHVSYIPFGYVRLTSSEVNNLPQSKTRSVDNAYAEKSPYTVTYDNYESTDGDSIEPKTFQLPILYVVWPVGKPLPDNLEYVIDHEVFMSPNDFTTRAAFASVEPYPVQLYVYDQGIKAPLANVAVEVYTNDYFYDPWDDRDRPGYWTLDVINTVTDDNGMIDIGSIVATYPSHFPNDPYCHLYVEVIYRDSEGRWKATSGNSTIPESQTDGRLFLFDWNPQDGDYSFWSDDRQLNQIALAANYFFNEQTDFPRPSISGGIQIIANSTPNRPTSTSYIGGMFSYPISGSGNPLIEIWNNGTPIASTIGTTLHELGHFAHYSNNNSGYRNTLLFLKESFSSYSGWYFTHSYYKSLGRTIYPDQDITAHGLYDGQGRQMWDRTTLDHYTPILVDLTDDMNQIGYYGYFNPLDYPNDNFKNVPATAVWSIITGSQNWTSFKLKLQSYAGTGAGKYYTLAQYYEWIGTFEQWLVRYPQYLTLL